MIYKDEIAAVRVAIKRTIKARSPEAGFQCLKKWSEKHSNRNISEVQKIFKKWLKRRFYNF